MWMKRLLITIVRYVAKNINLINPFAPKDFTAVCTKTSKTLFDEKPKVRNYALDFVVFLFSH